MRARYYNPDIKRFINQDIKVGDIGSSQSLNRYAYCEGNPVSMIDPFGLCGEDAQDQGSESKYKYLHAALDILGFAFDGADLINAGIYALENDWVNAGLCLVSFIPVAGSAIVGVAKSAKALKKLKTAEKVASFVAENGKNIRTASHMTEITHDTMKVIGECGSDTLKVVDGLSVNASYKGIRMLETGSDSAAKGAKKAIWEIQEAVGSEGIKFSTRVEESAQALKKTSSKRIKSGKGSELTIMSRNSGRGNPSAITHFDVELNTRQSNLLNKLNGYDSSIIVRKKDVNLKDLAALTAKTGDEFAMFTRGSQRLIIRGGATNININGARAQELLNAGYRWSGHTHPGSGFNVKLPSEGDLYILDKFNQSQSVIYDSNGLFNVFGGN